MYEALLQSTDRPFRATPDTRFYFPSDSIEQARQTILRTVLRAEGPSMVLGGAGCGKSMLCLKLAEDLDSRFDIVKLDSSGLCSRRALLQSILFDLRLPYRDLNEGELRMSIMDRLTPSPETAPEGVLLIVDEAQTLPGKLLEELRLITNFARFGQPRARLVLVGNMRLEDTFANPQMDSFNQRLAARCYLQPMTCEQTIEFVRHQFRCVGISPSNIVTGDALKTVYAASEGIPRLVNQVMDHALVLGIANGQCPISASLIEEAWSDLQQLPAPWHTANQAGDSPATKPTIIEFGELVDETEEAFDRNHRFKNIDVADAGQPLPPLQTSEPTEELYNSSELSVANLNEFEQQCLSPEHCQELDLQSGELTEYAEDLIDSAPLQSEELSFFAAFASPSHEQTISHLSEVPPQNEESLEVAEQSGWLPHTSTLPPAATPQATDSVTEIFDASRAFGFNRHSAMYARQEEPPVASSESFDTTHLTTSEQADTRELGGDFFAHRPSDADMLIAGDATYDSQGVWENDPPLPSPTSDQPTQSEVLQSLNKAELLFGEDFEEEIPVNSQISPATSHGSLGARAVTSKPAPVHATDLGDDTIATATRRAMAEEQLAALEVQLPISTENQPELLFGDVPPDQAAPTLKMPATLEGMYETAELANWTVDVAATEMDREIALHIEIEDLVSQLNFSAFAIEPFSVEQIDIDYQRNALSNQELQEANAPSADRETIYTLHTASSESLVGDLPHSEVHNNLTLDDDRDLLIIEEELPLSSKMTSQPPATQPTKATSYSQLFAKLRH